MNNLLNMKMNNLFIYFLKEIIKRCSLNANDVTSRKTFSHKNFPLKENIGWCLLRLSHKESFMKSLTLLWCELVLVLMLLL